MDAPAAMAAAAVDRPEDVEATAASLPADGAEDDVPADEEEAAAGRFGNWPSVHMMSLCSGFCVALK